MATPLVGLVGWRGMVGSVLMQRMQDEGDFAFIEPVFFSTSNAGGPAPAMAKNEKKLYSADDIDALKRHLPRWRLHQRDLPKDSCRWLERSLD